MDHFVGLLNYGNSLTRELEQGISGQNLIIIKLNLLD